MTPDMKRAAAAMRSPGCNRDESDDQRAETALDREDPGAGQPARIAAKNAPAVANRCSGALASARDIAAESSCGTLGMRQQSGIGSAEMCRMKTSLGPPLNGGRPLIISYAMQARL